MMGDGAALVGSYAGGGCAVNMGQPLAGADDGDTTRFSGISSSCMVAALDKDMGGIAGSSAGNVVTRLASACLLALRFLLT
jgi:hypothetical protein